jgi:hypothetical protein
MTAPRLVTVHAGSLWEVELLAGLLDAEGIATFLPDHLTKRVDPFITGANPLTSRLQVREEDAERATAILSSERSRLAEDAGAGLGDEEDEVGGPAGTPSYGPGEIQGDDAEEMTPDEELRYLATRTRWWSLISCAVAFLTLPFALLYFITYLRACKEYGRRAPGHGFTIATMLIVLAAAVALLGIALRLIAMDGP